MDINPAATAAQPKNRKSTYELPLTPFSEDLIEAAGQGKLRNAEPFLRHMATIKNLCNGLAVVLNIVGNVGIVEDSYDPADPQSEPPLSPYSVGAMIKMAEEVCHLISIDVEGVAQWAEKHARHEGQQ